MDGLDRAFALAVDTLIALDVDDPEQAAAAVIDAIVADRLACRQVTLASIEAGVWDRT